MEGGGSTKPFYRGTTTTLATNPTSAAVFPFLFLLWPQSPCRGRVPFWWNLCLRCLLVLRGIRNIGAPNHLLMLCYMALTSYCSIALEDQRTRNGLWWMERCNASPLVKSRYYFLLWSAMHMLLERNSWWLRLSFYDLWLRDLILHICGVFGWGVGLNESPSTTSNFSSDDCPVACWLTADFASEQNGAQKGDREAAVDAEIARVNKLPAHSSYAIHRMKVLNKLRHLLSIKVSTYTFWMRYLNCSFYLWFMVLSFYQLLW
jgi:hypothetical protein